MRVKTSVDMQTGVPTRNLIIEDIIARTGIDDSMIERLVRSFYGRAPLIRSSDRCSRARFMIGRFTSGECCAFWSSIVLMSGRYHGQPMVAHLPLPIDPPYFDRWLEIFANTARDVCPPSAAAHFLERAHRIADSLELGIVVRKGEIRPKRARPASTLPSAGDPNDARPAGSRPSDCRNG
jgi:hemoglobin